MMYTCDQVSTTSALLTGIVLIWEYDTVTLIHGDYKWAQIYRKQCERMRER